MKRKFNITGSCNPKRHYMVRLDDRLKKIREDYVDDGSYFIINRGRQYGKTTMLNALEEYLKDDYLVLSLDFQLMGTEDFSDEATFSRAFLGDIVTALRNTGTDDTNILIQDFIKHKFGDVHYGLKELFVSLSNMCRKSKKPILLMIDEVDSASNNIENFGRKFFLLYLKPIINGAGNYYSVIRRSWKLLFNGFMGRFLSCEYSMEL